MCLSMRKGTLLCSGGEPEERQADTAFFLFLSPRSNKIVVSIDRHVSEKLIRSLHSLPLRIVMYQPQVYRSIIDDVVANIQVDFEEYGMEEEVLINLQAVSNSGLPSIGAFHYF